MNTNSIDPDVFLSFKHQPVPEILTNIPTTMTDCPSNSFKCLERWELVGEGVGVGRLLDGEDLSGVDSRLISNRLQIIIFDFFLSILFNILQFFNWGFFHCWSYLFLNFRINKLLRLFLVSLRDKKVLILQCRFINFIILFSLLSFNTHNSIIF
jgi:hypothetical protein